VAKFAWQWWQRWQQKRVRTVRQLLADYSMVPISLTVSGLLLAGQFLGWLQRAELATYDQMVRLMPQEGADSRLLIVGVSDADINALGEWPLSNQTIAQALEALQQYQPELIGLDIYRDASKNPGSAALVEQLQADNVIVINKIGTAEFPDGIPAPAGVPPDRVGFNDVITDHDGVLRRALIMAWVDQELRLSFALQLASRYLAAVENIQPEYEAEDAYHFAYGEFARFAPLESYAGGYSRVDARGYQILLRYRSADAPARVVSLQDVLNNDLQPEWVRGKIVLLGATAPSLKDVFFTPYSPAEVDNPKMPGVLIHAQIVSQILAAVLDDRQLFSFWHPAGEVIWLVGWSVVGGLMGWRFHHPLQLGLAAAIGLGALAGSSYWLFTQAIWVPVVAPATGLTLSCIGVLGYAAYQVRREQQEIAKRVIDQDKSIAMLRMLLVEQDTPQKPRSHRSHPPAQVHSAPVPTIPGGVSQTAITRLPDELAELSAELQIKGETQIQAEPLKQPATNQLPAQTPWQTAIQGASAEPASVLRDRASSAYQTSPTRAAPWYDMVPEVPEIDQTEVLLSQRYRIRQVLGSGGFAITYLAKDTHRPGNPDCVVKRLLPARRDERFMQTARRLFKTEAEILEKLGRHDQIPQLLASFEEHEQFYLVEDFVDGQPLSDELKQVGTLSEDEILKLLASTLNVLGFIHDRHVIHRDIKPSNLMRRNRDRQIVLIDFGAVKQMQPQMPSNEEAATVAIGTRGYAPAEQLAGYPALNSDIYGLGIICIQAATGRLPNQLDHDPTTGNVQWRSLAKLSPSLADILDRMVCYYFNERYQSVSEVVRDLKPLIAVEGD